MYLLAQLWWFLAVACLIGSALGWTVRRVLLQRRIDAVHHGARVEQSRLASTMAEREEAHAQALAEQAVRLQRSLEQAHAHQLTEQLAQQAQTLHAAYAGALAQAQADWTDTLQAHARMQTDAQSALERAAAHITDQAARHGHARQLVAGEHRVAQAEVAALQQELAQLKYRLEEVCAQRDQAGLRLAGLQAELSVARQEQAVAAPTRQLLDEQQAALGRAQWEAAQLREQLDVALIELSAAARARDAREAQRAQLAQQLALAQDVRSREMRIASEQREQLMQRLMALRASTHQVKEANEDRAARLEAQRGELAAQLAASRRTTQAAVLAGQQREARLAAEMASLRAELNALRQRGLPVTTA